MDNMCDFLDNQQYTRRSINRYEKIYGEGSVSTGGVHHAENMMCGLNLKSGERILDIGAGIGGQAFYMAKKFKVEVMAIDFSKNMLAIARERFQKQDEEIRQLVHFHRIDVNEEELPHGRFDAVHCRDVMMHVSDKKLWLQKMMRCLKPGGNVAVSDYFRGDKENSDSFNEYVRSRRYFLVTLKSFEKLFIDVGFVNLVVIDGSRQYMEVLKNEITKLVENKEKYIEEFSKEEYNMMLKSWGEKLERNTAGDHVWGYIYAQRPT